VHTGGDDRSPLAGLSGLLVIVTASSAAPSCFPSLLVTVVVLLSCLFITSETLTFESLLRSDTGAKCCDEHVCLSVCLYVCLFARISKKTRPNFTKFYLHILSGAVARSSSEDDVLLCTVRFVHDVMFSHYVAYDAWSWQLGCIDVRAILDTKLS